MNLKVRSTDSAALGANPMNVVAGKGHFFQLGSSRRIGCEAPKLELRRPSVFKIILCDRFACLAEESKSASPSPSGPTRRGLLMPCRESGITGPGTNKPKGNRGPRTNESVQKRHYSLLAFNVIDYVHTAAYARKLRKYSH